MSDHETASAEILALLGHDLRSPLTVMRGYAELLMQRGDDLPAESRDSALVAICRSVDRISLVLDGLTELAEANGEAATSGGRAPEGDRGSDLVAVARDVLGSAVPAECSWALEGDPGPLPVAVPRSRIASALSLIASSFVLGGPEGDLIVDVERRRGDAEVRVSRESASGPPSHRLELVVAAALADASGMQLWADKGAMHLTVPLASAQPA